MKNNKLLPEICVLLGYVTCPVERGQTESLGLVSWSPWLCLEIEMRELHPRMCSDLPKATCW